MTSQSILSYTDSNKKGKQVFQNLYVNEELKYGEKTIKVLMNIIKPNLGTKVGLNHLFEQKIEIFDSYIIFLTKLKKK